MSILEPYADESQSATERLLETSWEGRERRASERELIVEASAAALFVVAAAVLVLLMGRGGPALRGGGAADRASTPSWAGSSSRSAPATWCRRS